MCPLSDRHGEDAEEEKPRSSRRWGETPRRRPEREDDPRPRKSARRQAPLDWEDDFDEPDEILEILEEDFDFDDQEESSS